MGTVCQVCHTTGSMRKCSDCGFIWCPRCANNGRYPGINGRYSTTNYCPICRSGNVGWIK